MASREQNSYEGCFSSYKFHIRLFESKLTLDAEHSRTKRLYKAELDQDAVNDITQNICETCEQLFELLQELIHNDGKCAKKNLEIIEEDTKLLLNLSLMVTFGRISRQFKIQIQLNSVDLDDVTRLQNIINEHAEKIEELQCSMNDRFDRAIKLVSAWEDSFQFHCLSPTGYVKLSNNARTITYKTQTASSNTALFGFKTDPVFGRNIVNSPSTVLTPINEEVVAITTQGFLSSVNRRYQLIRFNIQSYNILQNDKVCIGVVYQPKSMDWSKIIPSSNAWVFNVSNGSIQHSYFNDRPYTWSMNISRRSPKNESDATVHADLLLDILHRRIAFRIEDQAEDQWAFHLPEHLEINQLYPFIYLNAADISISIDF